MDSKEKYQSTFEGWDSEKFHALTRLLDRGTLDGGEEGQHYPSPTLWKTATVTVLPLKGVICFYCRVSFLFRVSYFYPARQ